MTPGLTVAVCDLALVFVAVLVEHDDAFRLAGGKGVLWTELLHLPEDASTNREAFWHFFRFGSVPEDGLLQVGAVGTHQGHHCTVI